MKYLRQAVLTAVLISSLVAMSQASDQTRQPNLPETTPRLLYIQSILHQIFVGNNDGAICLAQIYEQKEGSMDEETAYNAGIKCNTYMIDTIFIYKDWAGALKVFERKLYNAYQSELGCVTRAITAVSNIDKMSRNEAQNLNISHC